MFSDSGLTLISIQELVMMAHGAEKTAKQIKKIAVTFYMDFSNQYAAGMLWKKKKVNFSITFQENSILLKSYFLQEVGVVPPW